MATSQADMQRCAEQQRIVNERPCLLAERQENGQ